MGLLEKSSGTPQLHLKASSFNSYNPKREKLGGLTPTCSFTRLEESSLVKKPVGPTPLSESATWGL